MPDTAAGITTRMLVVRRRAPRPTEASRSDPGTACIASSATEATSGVTSNPTASPAAATLKIGTSVPKNRWITSGLMNRSAKKAP